MLFLKKQIWQALIGDVRNNSINIDPYFEITPQDNGVIMESNPAENPVDNWTKIQHNIWPLLQSKS